MGLGSSRPGGTTGGQSNQGNNSSQNGGGRRRREGNDAPVSLLQWMDPRGPISHYVEGQTPLSFEEGMISSGENSRRLAAIKGQQAEFAASFALRKKIKPIKDPEGDKSETRRTAAKRKRRGRVGTTTLGNASTLG